MFTQFLVGENIIRQSAAIPVMVALVFDHYSKGFFEFIHQARLNNISGMDKQIFDCSCIRYSMAYNYRLVNPQNGGTSIIFKIEPFEKIIFIFLLFIRV
jgi:hypothetical protein